MQITQPSIVLIANPSTIAYGGSVAIGWVTSGMRACTVSSPDSASFTAANANNQSINGVATTTPIIAPMDIVLDCQTINGGIREAVTSVSITGASSTRPLTVSSNADGGSVSHGSSVRVVWSSISPVAGSAVSLWLVDNQAAALTAVIAGGLSPNGTYLWHIPDATSVCNPNAATVCARDLVNGNTYSIEAVSYTPSNAYVGDGVSPKNPIAPIYGASGLGGIFRLTDTTAGGE
jgi:hypothetical protein